MSHFLLDTDTFSDYLRHRPAVLAAIVRNLGSRLSLSIITVEELWDGWKAVLRNAKTDDQIGMAYDRLTATMSELKEWSILSFDVKSVATFESLKKLRLNVGSNDLRIAAIAREVNATVVTRNVRDFSRVPGLSFVDWSQ